MQIYSHLSNPVLSMMVDEDQVKNEKKTKKQNKTNKQTNKNGFLAAAILLFIGKTIT